MTDSTVTLEVINGSLSLGAASSSTFGGAVIVSSGASLNVGAGATVEIGGGQTLTDNGMVSFASGDTVTLNVNCCYSSQAIQVNGDLTADDTTINDNTTNGSSVISINSGGKLQATGSTFSLTYLTNNSAVYKSGDLHR